MNVIECVCKGSAQIIWLCNVISNTAFFCLFQVDAVAHQCHNTGLRSDEPVDSGCVKFNMPVTRLELLGPCGIADLRLKKYIELIAETTATCPNDLLEDTENEDAKNI